MRRALGSGVAGVAALAMLATGTAHAANGTYYSSKQPYIVPQQALDMSYSAAPEGYTITYTEMLARHGSRGLSSYKYDALLMKMAETAKAEDGFVDKETGEKFIKNLEAITAANVDNGYGMLTGQGESQHQGIGERAYKRNQTLFDQAAADGEKIEYESSGEARATESGENFKIGFDSASKGELANSYVTPANPTGQTTDGIFNASPNILYFHKVKNPDGNPKENNPNDPEDAYDIAQRYEDFINADSVKSYIDAVEDYKKSEDISRDLLSTVFKTEFIDKIGTDKDHMWYNTIDGKPYDDEDENLIEDGTSDHYIGNCAPNAKPDDKDACGEASKSIESVVDAAMDLYNLYIIAADMTVENAGSHTFDFDQYFADIAPTEGETFAETFAWILDAEDFYEKGPSVAGQTETYRIAQPLLDDFFNSIDDRVADGGTTAATFRFAHAETIIPFAALIKAPGSEEQIPQDKIYDPLDLLGDQGYQSNWYGESVTPMAANIQWDVATKDGKDPKTGKAYTPLVRMLYNETEVPFNASCTPVAEGSTWYKESELKSCLGLEEKRDQMDEEPTITVDTDTSGDQQQDGNTQNDQKQDAGDATKQPSASDRPKTIPKTGSAMIVPAVAGVVLVAAGVTLVFIRRAKQR
ncbi:histidine-type phosphatase [Bifidobacterium pullorum subsp. gallinarum]|uniref:Multiple inositol polyphosphate phosphatase 1 n=1 Tax=Bifidobacterium pullorum subsp. gallinarum TaxID=78344 RepID=A0A4P6DUS5_9BIFI|nr:histidine-type phosphatase [Bifidobacterium pullorum]QAY33801.1 histidine-type phosphatase [Bifidobacterium pullorum subsp. gallinarum]